MIILKPGKEVTNKYKDLDFNTLSSVFTLIYDSYKTHKREHKIYLHIRLQCNIYSEYAWGDNCIYMSNQLPGEKLFLKHLLHEYRHYLQYRVFKVSSSLEEYDDSSFKKYHSSPVEVDARNFENIAGVKAIRLYYRLIKMKKYFAPFTYKKI